MTTYVALLRAVNVGGTGKLPMRELVRMAEELGFSRVRTYIASGNLVFESAMKEPDVKAALEKALAEYAGKKVGVMVRSAAEIEKVVADNPFSEREPARTAVHFLDTAPPEPLDFTAPDGEEVRAGTREIYVFYPNGMGRSKLRLPAVKNGTARNVNTVSKLAGIARELTES